MTADRSGDPADYFAKIARGWATGRSGGGRLLADALPQRGAVPSSGREGAVLTDAVLRGGRALGSWLEDAACGSVDPRLFDYGEEDDRDDRRARAARVCAGCSVLFECRSAAVTLRGSGTWGGDHLGPGPRPANRKGVAA